MAREGENTCNTRSEPAMDEVGLIKFCGPCVRENKTTAAHVYCSNCEEYQCSECSEGHVVFEFMTGHEMVNVWDVGAMKSLVDLQGLDMCPRHEKGFCLFCVDHQMLCCRTCAFTEHRGCKEVNEVTVEAAEENVDFDDLQDTLGNLELDIDWIKAVDRGRPLPCSEIRSLMDKLFEIEIEISKRRYALKDKIKKQTRQVFETHKSGITEKLTIGEHDMVADLEKYQEMISAINMSGSTEQKFIAMHLIEKKLGAYRNTPRERQGRLDKLDLSIEYSRALKDALECSEDLVSLVTSKRVIEPSIHDGDKPVKLKFMVSLEIEREVDDTKEPSYQNVEFLPDGRLVLFDAHNPKLKIMDESFQTLTVYRFNDLREHLFVLSNDELIVTGPEVEFLNVSETNVVTVAKAVTPRYFHYSLRDTICLVNETQFTVFRYRTGEVVTIIARTGEENDWRSLVEQLKREASFVYVRSGDKIVLAEVRRNSVLLYDYKQKLMPKCEVECLTPTDICVGPHNCFYVCSKGAGAVIQMTPSGRVIASHKLEMKCPRSLCISKNGTRLAIASKTKLRMYEIVQWTKNKETI